MIKLLIADDQQLIRDSLKIVLDTNDTIEVMLLPDELKEKILY